MSFKLEHEPTNPLFRNLKIIKFKDILAYDNCIFVHDQLNEDLPKSFNKFFMTAQAQKNYNARGSRNNTIIKSITNSVIYGLNSVKHRAASDWNAMIKDINIIGIDRQDLMKSLKERIFEPYTYFKKGFSHTQNPISKIKHKSSPKIIFSLFPSELLSFAE